MEGKVAVDGWFRSRGITHNSQIHDREQDPWRRKESQFESILPMFDTLMNGYPQSTLSQS